MGNNPPNPDRQKTVLLGEIDDQQKMLNLMNKYKSEGLPNEEFKSFAATQLMKNKGAAARQLFGPDFKPSEDAVPKVNQSADGTYSIEYDGKTVDKIPAEQINRYAMDHVDDVDKFYKERLLSSQAKLNDPGYTQPTDEVATNDEKSQEKPAPAPVIVSQDDYLEGVSLLFVTPEDLKSELDNPDSEVSKSLATFNNLSQEIILTREEQAKIANEVQKIEEEMEDLKQQYTDQAQAEAIKKFWEATDGSQEQKDALKLLQEKIKAEDAARLQALNGAKAKLANATNNLNNAQTNLGKVLNERSTLFTNDLVNDKNDRIKGIETKANDNLAREEKILRDLKTEQATLQTSDPNYATLQGKIAQQEKVVGLQNKAVDRARTFVNEQTGILKDQAELRDKRDAAFSPVEKGKAKLNIAEFDQSSVAGQSSVVSSIQYARADRDIRAFEKREEEIGDAIQAGREEPKPVVEGNLKPSEIRLINAKLAQAMKTAKEQAKQNTGVDEEKEKENISQYKKEIASTQSTLNAPAPTVVQQTTAPAPPPPTPTTTAPPPPPPPPPPRPAAKPTLLMSQMHNDIRAPTAAEKAKVLQTAKDNDIPESKFVKYGKAAGWTLLDMMTASLGVTSQKSGKLITASLIRDFVVAGRKDKADLKPMFDFLEKQVPKFEKIGSENGYDSAGNPMTTWIFRGGNPVTNISVSRDTIGASNPESKEMFLKCVDQYAQVKNKVDDKGKITLNISGDKNAVQGLKETIDGDPKLNKFRDMNGLPKPQAPPGVTPSTTPTVAPPPTPQAPSPSGPH